MPNTIADAEQRAAALDPGRSFIVQAPAGSGKTELLIQRTLALLARVQAPEEVLAITFTRKAAQEMRSRIMQALQRAAAGEQPAEQHQKLTLDLAGQVLEQSTALGWELQATPSRLRIQTIDSLCTGLVSRMPLLSRFGGQVRISDSPEQLYTQAARAAVAELESNADWSPAVRTMLRHLDNDLQRACTLIADMLPKREQWLRHIADPQNRQIQKPDLEQALDRVVREALQEAREIVPEQEAGRLLRLAGFAARHMPDPDKNPGLEQCLALQELPRARADDLQLWQALSRLCLTKKGQLRKKADKSLGFPAPSSCKDPRQKAEYQSLKDDFLACMQTLSSVPGLEDRLYDLLFLPWPEYTEEQWTVLRALIEVLRLSAAHLHLIFQKQGTVDFAEVASRARMALGSPEEPTDLTLALDQRIQHLLIDEFQDTSISQFLLLQALTAGWTPGDGRTFFAVGDPMQSIYSFREAEVGLFLQSRQNGLGQVPLTPLVLQVNFRAQAELVHWVNQAFPQVLPQVEDPLTGRVPYAPARPYQAPGQEPAVCVHPFFNQEQEAEARSVVSLINQARTDFPQGTIAVLVRSRAHLQYILPALRQARIDFQAVDIDPLSQRPAIQDLSALTKALQHPGHDLAWMAVLRAPWCALDLHDLHRLSPAGQQCTVWQRIQDDQVLEGLSARGRQALGRVRPVLQEALHQRERSSLRRQVESCWQALGGPDCLQNQSELQDAQSFFDLLQYRFAAAPETLLSELDQALSRLFARPEAEAGQDLQVMTMHKAKGLEFDTVILPGLGNSPRSRDYPLLAWLERSSREQGELSDLLLAPRTGFGQDQDPVYAYIQRLIQQKQAHEDGRLLYVAATRAKKRLHLLGQTSLTAEGQPQKPESGSLLAALWPAVQDEFDKGAVARANEQNGAGLDSEQKNPAHTGQVLHRLPANWQPPRKAPGLQPAVSVRPEPEQEDIPFDWAGEMVRCVGTCVHGWLLIIARQGLTAWNAAQVPGLRPVFVRQLKESGLRTADVSLGADLVQQALENTLQSDTGRWILKDRPGAQNEYALSGLDQGRLVSVVMDRTFVDEEDRRWIIDYKTSRHEGRDLQDFLDQEVLRYQQRMQIYATLMQAKDKRPVWLGLYFPLLDAWRQWSC